MIESDLAQFSEVLDSLSDYYQKDALKEMAVKIYFRALQPYSMEAVCEAVNLHLQDTNGGRFYPKAADLIGHIEGGEITPEIIIAAAHLGKTPLGILAKIKIGQWTLDRGDSFQLRQCAIECLQLLPEWKEQARTATYTDHAISIMIKYGVNPAGAFSIGMIPNANSDAINERVLQISQSKRHINLMEPSFDHGEEAAKNPEGLARIGQAIADAKADD